MLSLIWPKKTLAPPPPPCGPVIVHLAARAAELRLPEDLARLGPDLPHLVLLQDEEGRPASRQLRDLIEARRPSEDGSGPETGLLAAVPLRAADASVSAVQAAGSAKVTLVILVEDADREWFEISWLRDHCGADLARSPDGGWVLQPRPRTGRRMPRLRALAERGGA